MANKLEVVRLRHGPFWNVTYIVGPPGGDALVIDPAWDVVAIIEAAEELGLRIRSAAVTHGHHDHVHGLGELVDRTGAEVFVHHLDADLLRREFRGRATAVGDGHEIDPGGIGARVLHTPGHTRGSVVISMGGHLFTGDTLMVGATGRHGAYAGAREALRDSLARLGAAVPPAMLVHPGHDTGPRPSATLESVMRLSPSSRAEP